MKWSDQRKASFQMAGPKMMDLSISWTQMILSKRHNLVILEWNAYLKLTQMIQICLFKLQHYRLASKLYNSRIGVQKGMILLHPGPIQITLFSISPILTGPIFWRHSKDNMKMRTSDFKGTMKRPWMKLTWKRNNW